MIEAAYHETAAPAAAIASLPLADLGELLARAIREQCIIAFPAGLPGFADAKRFTLGHAKGSQALCQLASCEPGGPVFRLLIAGSAREHPMIAEHCLDLLNEPAQMLFLMTKVQTQADRWVLTANCRAPIVIDLMGLEGEQVILHDETQAKSVVIASGPHRA